MGALSEYLELKNESYLISEEVSRVLNDRKRTNSEKREIVEKLQKKLRSKKQKIKILHDRVVEYYVFPGTLIILAYLAFQFSEYITETLIEILMKFI
ncbi:hypothetical protein [Methanococcus maripaludis]|jgi:predicted nucleotide-binding protein (sugar kinase/HSP70/actin superfamily)|uniref:Uncharacterized protein n=5 Tax=Methanococcus maripaludis TaxID=39152 RepID=Q6LZR2_METMP|nr:hypothetical protein [Methanococcus maripaludis]AEK19612.1 hypothetical protein GYY_03665 [Methanococcus maripaludis X1]MBA2846370.1 putative nucleotide-binding protein (sugar kinase/HSP70/actin superfamily) [Methanococcus maripaludis]MBA2851067.1 putative nucleotide-binding protein (sugar kinase/HSP70/actin superfamily) [Methanococcus maripaludis]MBB6067656.1 putative nucleotide-binding protein (sugar kinase/HSP70/actin superfamily) [Methanococcus maripaludis]MBG0769786.1 hypothetical prot